MDSEDNETLNALAEQNDRVFDLEGYVKELEDKYIALSNKYLDQALKYDERCNEVIDLKEKLKIAVDSISCAVDYLESCGYTKEDDYAEPEYQMMIILKDTLEKIKSET